MILLALLPILVRGDYPGQLQWSTGRSSCGSENSFCATLEFCKDGSNYGYRIVGDTSACGSKPGPLIRMTPGNKYKLTLHNSADPFVLTNIHTHGLHIVGDGDGDDVTRFVNGGSCLDYTWDIAADHPGGTNWYHPHK
jgi:FtsP/CotA-like multicopper oxidase with cupredoxin domain